MDPKLRIMTIRLINKVAEHPKYAASVGVEGYVKRNQGDQSERSK